MPFAIVELDQVLAQDTEGEQVQALHKKLVDAAEQCRARLDQGVAPDEAKRLNALMGAFSAGLGLLPALWHAQQERS
jgi:hypothetical protein